MIARQLTRIPYYGATAEMKILEAFAFTYAAGYCNGVISNRMKESYQRAWDFDQWAFLPDIPLGPPGCVVARFEGDFRPKLVIAIRGISSWSQLLPIRSGAGATAMPSYGGSVYAPFKSGADLLYTALAATTLFSEYYAISRIPVVITGHSMGAAIAEILAARFRLEKPGRDIRCIKFASPRVGTQAWVDDNTHSHDHSSVYVRPDPIINFPWQSVPQAQVTIGGVFPAWSNFVKDPFINTYTYFGEPHGLWQYSAPTLAQSIAGLSSWPPPALSPWWVHSPNSYRFAMTGLSHYGEGWGRWRFRYLEHTDEDLWGKNFQLKLPTWVPLMALGATNPPDVTVELPESEFKDYARPRPQEFAENDLYGGGGSWGGPPPAPPRRTIHHFPRP